VHIGAKTKNYVQPDLMKKIESLGPEGAEIGWVDEDKIRMHAFPPAADTRVFVCGLPGVYDKLCGPRLSPFVTKDSALGNLGYSNDMVVKF
jgi:cytochrome-b5 reductase